ncbi:hypothetical protein M5689_019689 [Euphorbia peplus]|nr:hypothetical protein M5689_019689 [Euphorbia peplus]
MRKDSKKPISSNQQDTNLSRKRVFEEGENSHEKKECKKRKTNNEKEVKNKKKAKFKDESFDDIPEILSSKLVKQIDKKGGSNVELVITKRLFATDLNTHHDRLAIPANQAKDNCGFLTTEEKALLDIQGNTLDVELIEPSLEESKLKLVKWNYKQSYSYNLRTSWNNVLKRNIDRFFKLNDVIQLWSFRVNGQLWFALQKVQDAPQTSA